MPPAIVFQLLFGLLDRAAAVGTLIKTAQSEGRDVTEAELDALVADDDEAKAQLKAAIDAARNTQ